MNLPKKALYFFLLFLFFIPVVYPNKTVAASENIFEQSYKKKAEDEKRARSAEDKGEEVQIFSTRVNNQALGDAQFNLINQILPLDPELASSQTSAIGVIASLMGAMYEYPPASSFVYAYDLIANAGLVKKAHAQGIGFVGLSPLFSLWKTARNISYAALVIVMLAIGLMLIFRVKIDPKTVISIQAALPKIIIALVLITFSYPIVGFMIDIMYLSMAIIISMLAQGMGEPFASQIQTLQSQYMAGGVNILLGAVFGSGFRSLDDFLKAFLGGAPVSGFAALIIHGLITSLSSGVFALITALPVLLFLLILVLGLLFTFIRLLLLLVNSYIQIIISVILAPLLLLTEAIPGRSAFKGWILNILANLVVFPTTVAVLMFAMFLATRNVGESPWMAPLIWLPGTTQFGGFLALAVLFLAPSLVAKVKKAFHPKPALPVTAGTAFAPLTGGAQTAMGAASQFYYLKASLQGLPIIGEKLGKPH